MRRGRRPRWMIKIAIERMEILLNLAEEEFALHPERSHRYVEMARKIATKYNLKMPYSWKGRFCRNCNHFLKPGSNSIVRLSDSMVNIKCLECGEIMRKPYIREKKAKRRNKIESRTFQKGTDA
ncbi:MAG: ribonuclease P [Methanobacteriaceae archaeon]|nr:ribonuclease P [Methanobacteriaceae archaeon]